MHDQQNEENDDLIIPEDLIESSENNENIDDIEAKINEIIKTVIIERPNVSELAIVEGKRIFYDDSGFNFFDLPYEISDNDIIEFQTKLLLKRFRKDEERIAEIEDRINRKWWFNYSFVFKWIPLRCNWSIWDWKNFFRMRRIMDKVPSPVDLGIPDIVREKIRDWRSWWLIVVSAPVWQGKSTTIASLIQELIQEECLNVITLEDPKEYVYNWGKSIIEQREIWNDLDTYMSWIADAMRQKPNIVIIQEMTDPEVVKATMHLLEKWVMVITTLHTPDTPSIFEAILNVYSETERDSYLAILRENFKCFISQRLIPRANWKGRVAVFEVLNNTPKAKWYLEPNWNIRNIHQIMETDGNIVFWQSILKRIEYWDILPNDWISYCPQSRRKILEQELEVSEG